MSEELVNDHTLPEEAGHHDHERFTPFFPNYVLDELIVWYIALAVLIALASLFPSGIEEQANPLSTPAHVKPEWSFLFLYQTLKLVPRLVGLLISGVGVLLLFALPFLDRGPSRRIRDRKMLITIVIAVISVIAILTVWGWQS